MDYPHGLLYASSASLKERATETLPAEEGPMFCKSCGQAIEEGKAFCKACGTPVAPETPPVAVPPSSPVSPPPIAATPPPPPPVAVVPPPLPAASGYGGGQQPSDGASGRKGRGGLLLGIVAAVIIVLAGAGLGVYFGFFRDGDDGSAGNGESTSTTLAGYSSTSTSLSTSSGGETTTTMIGASTTQTIPNLSTSSTDSTEDLLTLYLMATDGLVAELEADDARIPILATEINNTAPNAPTRVRDELEAMLDRLDASDMELAALDVPAGFQESDHWLEVATTHMANRIYATIQGIEAMWDTDNISSSASFFDKGRQERDEYRVAFQKFHDAVPID